MDLALQAIWHATSCQICGGIENAQAVSRTHRKVHIFLLFWRRPISSGSAFDDKHIHMLLPAQLAYHTLCSSDVHTILVVNSQNHLLTCTQLGGGSLRLAASCSSAIIACAADWLTQDSAWLLEQATTCVDSYFAASLPTAAASPVTTPEVEAWSAEADRWGIAASSGISAGNILQAHGLL